MALSFSMSDEQVQRLLNAFVKVGEGVSEVQSLLAQVASTRPIQQPQQPNQPPNQLGGLGTLPPPDIRQIKWKVKGGGDAGPTDGYAFAFAANQDGSPNPETASLVAYLQAHGNKAEIGGYLITLKDKFVGRAIKKK